jgi:hypothetical protein
MSPYRSSKPTPSTSRTKSAGDASWVLVLAALPIFMKTVSFPEHTWNILAWMVVSLASAASALYTLVLFAFTMSHMLPAARRDQQHRSPGIFDPANFDEAGQSLHAKFRHAFMLFVLAAMLAGVVAIVFPL